ncbi:MAG: hypothetical protein ABEJ36_01270 [Candidatus Nanosalina sp.]
MEKIEKLEDLEKEDRVLFNDRAVPLTVEETGEKEVFVEGPHGGEYRIYDEDAKHFLIAKPGKERYSSYCKDLRRVGQWEKPDPKTWRHTETDAEISIVKNTAGFWNLDIQNFEKELDLPKYGFLDLENAEDEAEKIVNKNPEG